jgi:prepilin-type N-terminal cleavage/methylation domain-containing protein
VNSRGVTLVELLVVLTILGISAGVVALSLPGSIRSGTDLTGELLAAHLRAARTGEEQRVPAGAATWQAPVLLLPDGRIISDSLDPFGGAPLSAVRHAQ